jgi:L-seryl-tRNA(Ser) seleniumtransferase
VNETPFRGLPSVTSILDRPELVEAATKRGHSAVVRAVRSAIQEARDELARNGTLSVDHHRLAQRALDLLAAKEPVLRTVLNASGVLLHTGLGRAPLAPEAAEAVARVARGYCNLEFELETGERGRRTSGVDSLLQQLTGAEAATVVNNNAAATILALRALAHGRDVVVSRGQLVEIGGSFRLPEIFEVSGARLREVGTTNRTRLSDYERAIGPETAVLLRVHASNYRIVGFTEDVPIGPLADLAHARGLVTIDDIGSGALAPGLPPGIAGEPSIADSLAAGADLVLCSGDKLLGGPQCGLLIGKKAVIARISSDPLMRAVRVDKMTLTALEATLRLALDPARGRQLIPLWAFLSTPPESLRSRAEVLAERIRSRLRLKASIESTSAMLGGGSVPAQPIPSFAVRLDAPFPMPYETEGGFARALRLSEPPVVPRVRDGAILLDLRAIPESDDEVLWGALARLVAKDVSET